MFFKIITKRRGVFEAAGQGDFCNGIVCRTEHLGCHTKAVPEEILFWRGMGIMVTAALADYLNSITKKLRRTR